jgi:two-component system nitrate/nitrite sensor histidine kinase NarX
MPQDIQPAMLTKDQGQYRLPALSVLSEIATSLSTDSDVEQLLDRFLVTMIRLAGAEAGAVRVITADGKGLRLIGSLGLPQDVVDREAVVPVGCGACGQAMSDRQVHSGPTRHECRENANLAFFGERSLSVFAVPLRHKGQLLGVYNLFMPLDVEVPEEIRLLFSSISEHLGLALENARLTRENIRITLMNERQMLANEIHDSLAQTLAYMKMRLKMLETAVGKGDATLTDKFLGDVDEALESAYSGLRELITQFRQGMDSRGLIPALNDLLSGVHKKIEAQTELINHTSDLNLNPDEEAQIYRIAQEALANICKHSYARNVLIKLEEDDQNYTVSVCDDGIGLYAAGHRGPGMHFGMNIMHERASKIGGKVEIKSRVGGGTRVILNFPKPAVRKGPQ